LPEEWLVCIQVARLQCPSLEYQGAALGSADRYSMQSPSSAVLAAI